MSLLIFLSFILIIYCIIRYLVNNPNANTNVDMTGKVVIITGCNTGIGKATCLALAKMNATIIMANRDENKSKKAMDYIIPKSGNSKIHFIRLDLADLESVVHFVKQFKQMNLGLDVLINNAGCTVDLKYKRVTKQGYEQTIGVNYLGHYLLNMLLIDEVVKSKGRIVILCSGAHALTRQTEKTFDIRKYFTADFSKFGNGYLDSFEQYCVSKLFNMLHARELHERYYEKGVKVISINPGTFSFGNLPILGPVNTEIQRDTPAFIRPLVQLFMYLFFRTPMNGAQNTIHAATSMNVRSNTYLENLREGQVSKLGKNTKFQKELFDYSYTLVENYLK